MLVTANGATVTNTVTLSNTNTFTGGLNIQGAGVALGAVGAAGTGNIVLWAAHFQFSPRPSPMPSPALNRWPSAAAPPRSASRITTAVAPR